MQDFNGDRLKCQSEYMIRPNHNSTDRDRQTQALASITSVSLPSDSWAVRLYVTDRMCMTILQMKTE